jgi:hypothetical protein
MDTLGYSVAHIDGLDKTQLLEITACIVNLPFKMGSSSMKDASRTLCITLLIDHETEMVIHPRMDTATADLQVEDYFTGLILDSETNIESAKRNKFEPIVLILESHGNHYERVGSFQFVVRRPGLFSDIDEHTARADPIPGSMDEDESNTWLWLRDAKRSASCSAKILCEASVFLM